MPSPTEEILEGEEAAEAVAEAGRKSTSRRELNRHEGFEDVSPELGVLDEDAFMEHFSEHPDEAMALLADMTAATDQNLKALARSLAGRVMVDVARIGRERKRGIGKLRRKSLHRAEGDIDLEESLEAITEASALGIPPDPQRLVVSTWEKPSTAVCLLVDRSGSMAGDRLATAAVAAAAVVFRAPLDCSVVCFSDQSVVVKSQTDPRDPDGVVSDVLGLRGFGITDIGLALRTASRQLSRSRAGRKLAILMSDCRATTGGDPLPHVAGIDELVILAPADDTADAEAMANALGCRWTTMDGPSAVAEALTTVLLG